MFPPRFIIICSVLSAAEKAAANQTPVHPPALLLCPPDAFWEIRHLLRCHTEIDFQVTAGGQRQKK